MDFPSVEAFSIRSLLTLCFLSPPSFAGTWYWRGVEVLGNRTVSRAAIERKLPLRMGSAFVQDPAAWARWCASLEKKFSFVKTECSAVRYANFQAYLVVDVVEKGDEARLNFRPTPAGDVALATAEILSVYDALYARLWELFEKGTPPTENTKAGYLDYTDAQMHVLVQKLSRLVPAYRENILQVLEEDRSPEKRAQAANLLNWTQKALEDSIVRASRVLDDPSTEVRNNISRFLSPFLHQLRNAKDRNEVTAQLLRQLDRPSFADRNKSLYSLLHIAQSFPEDRPAMRRAGLPLVAAVAAASILENVQGPAKELALLLRGAGP